MRGKRAPSPPNYLAPYTPTFSIGLRLTIYWLFTNRKYPINKEAVGLHKCEGVWGVVDAATQNNIVPNFLAPQPIVLSIDDLPAVLSPAAMP